jgi:hypothetical protein
MAQELAHVVAGRDRRHAEDLVRADHDAGLGLHECGGLGVVHHGPRVLGHLEFDVDTLVVADLVAQVLEADQGLLVLGLGEGAQRAGDPGRRRDHVDRGARVDGAGTAHAVGLLVAQAGGHLAQPAHQLGRGPDDVALGGRHCAMSARSTQRDPQRVRFGHRDARAQGHEARRHLGRDMEPDEPGPLHGGERAAFEHRRRPAQGFLRGLEQEDVAAGKILPARRQQ